MSNLRICDGVGRMVFAPFGLPCFSKHVCCWESCGVFAYCGLVVEIPTKLLKLKKLLLPFQRQPSKPGRQVKRRLRPNQADSGATPRLNAARPRGAACVPSTASEATARQGLSGKQMGTTGDELV